MFILSTPPELSCTYSIFHSLFPIFTLPDLTCLPPARTLLTFYTRKLFSFH
jgi:hypothetical protein